MEKLKAIYKISLFSMSLVSLLFSFAISAATAESVPATITETQITTNTSNQWDPAIYGNKIVWEDHRNGNSDIYMFNISSKEEIQITTNTSYQWDPAIHSNRIVWTDNRNDGWWYIYMYDLTTKKEIQIPTNNDVTGESTVDPAIYGDKIVRGYSFEEYSQIYMYDLSTSKETQISTGGRAYNPAIYGDRIVWTDDRDGDYRYDIYMYDISTKNETQITTSGKAETPKIYGNRIVYTDNRNGNDNIYMYNISTKKETQITSSPDHQKSPDIYGNRIVWKDVGGEDDGWEYHGIYMCDLSTNQKMKITSGGSGSDPAIYGNRVVYSDDRNGDYDIYMSTISSGEPEPVLPVANFSANPTSGKAPLNVSFTDNSTGVPTAWKWNFGDGTNSTEQNPMHTYSKAGNYTVRLTATNDAGSNTKTKSSYIKVTSVTRPVANFTSNVTSGYAPLNVAFTDKSTGVPTAWNWSFGDGINSTEQNPVHKYSKAGNYTVVLTASNSAGSNKITKPSYIKVTTNTRPGTYSE